MNTKKTPRYPRATVQPPRSVRDRLDAVLAFVLAIDDDDAILKEMTAGAVLLSRMEAADRRLTLRAAWRLIPKRERSAPALRFARRFAPNAVQRELQGRGGAR